MSSGRFVREDALVEFKHSLQKGYSDLRKLELEFAMALDKTKLPWVRNPARGSGYGIPLITRGATKTFYPDFLVWNGDDIFALDPKGGHLLPEAATRKLLHVRAPSGGDSSLHVRLVSEGTWTVRNMPDCLQREPMTFLQPASITPEPIKKPWRRKVLYFIRLIL